MKLALASTVIGLSRATWPGPREGAAHEKAAAATSTSTRALGATRSGMAPGYLGSSGACDPALPAQTSGTCGRRNIDAGVLGGPAPVCDPAFCLPRYECTAEGACQPAEPVTNPFGDWCAYNKNLCAYQSVICDRHAGEYFFRAGGSYVKEDCAEPPESCSIANCCEDATCTPDIPPASDISLSEANCAYHSKMCDKYKSQYVDYDGVMNIYVPFGPKFAHCQLSKECCSKETQEERDLCYKVHECTHNADLYMCAGEATCSEFSILGYETDFDCKVTKLERASCRFRDCCRDANGDADKVRQCVYTEEPAPEEDDEPGGQEMACLYKEDCAAEARRRGMAFVAGAYPTAGCFSKKNKAYFSPGTVEAMTEAELPGVQERIYCDKEAVVTSSGSGENLIPCLTESQCDEARQEEGLDEFSSGNFPTRGCFRKNGKAYWGRGGSRAEVSEEDLPGVQERIYCLGNDQRSSVVLSKASVQSEVVVSGATAVSLGLSMVAVLAAFSSIR